MSEINNRLIQRRSMSCSSTTQFLCVFTRCSTVSPCMFTGAETCCSVLHLWTHTEPSSGAVGDNLPRGREDRRPRGTDRCHWFHWKNSGAWTSVCKPGKQLQIHLIQNQLVFLESNGFFTLLYLLNMCRSKTKIRTKNLVIIQLKWRKIADCRELFGPRGSGPLG